jgi:twitching motility two-component system response regulator PilH
MPTGSALPLQPRPTVLVVDDDRDIREMYTSALRMAGFDVRAAMDGMIALRQIEHQRPDVVVLDLDLPLINGIAVHGELESNVETHALPVVIVTGTEMNSPFPAYATLRKPLDPDVLVGVVRRASTSK